MKVSHETLRDVEDALKRYEPAVDSSKLSISAKNT